MKLEIISRSPEQAHADPPLLLVHGAWHGAWCWDVHFVDYLVQQGFTVCAPSLRGHGKSEGREQLRWARVADYVDDIASVARQLPAPPVLIGHSMGGLVVQKYLERHAAPAAVLLASVPPSGVLATTLRIALRHPLRFLKVNLTMSLYPIVATPALAREMFFSQALSEAEVQTHWQHVQDESYLGFLDMLALDLPHPGAVKTPVLVMGASEDAVFRPYEIEATARAYNTTAEIFQGMAHDMMLEPDWKSVAERIATWLKARLPE